MNLYINNQLHKVVIDSDSDTITVGTYKLSFDFLRALASFVAPRYISRVQRTNATHFSVKVITTEFNDATIVADQYQQAIVVTDTSTEVKYEILFGTDFFDRAFTMAYDAPTTVYLDKSNRVRIA